MAASIAAQGMGALIQRASQPDALAANGVAWVSHVFWSRREHGLNRVIEMFSEAETVVKAQR